jgi:hypothetical protein
VAVRAYTRQPRSSAEARGAAAAAIDVLRIEDGAVVEIVTFDASVFGSFGLPESVA